MNMFVWKYTDILLVQFVWCKAFKRILEHGREHFENHGQYVYFQRSQVYELKSLGIFLFASTFLFKSIKLHLLCDAESHNKQIWYFSWKYETAWNDLKQQNSHSLRPCKPTFQKGFLKTHLTLNSFICIVWFHRYTEILGSEHLPSRFKSPISSAKDPLGMFSVRRLWV